MRRTTKVCPACPGGPQEKPLEAFGVNRARKDGRNCYCMECVRRRMNDYRVKYRERRQVLKRLAQARRPVRVERVEAVRERRVAQTGNLAPVTDYQARGLVLQAIDRSGGKASQEKIVTYAREAVRGRNLQLTIEDNIGDALGELFGARLIGTRGEAEGRVYFRRDFVRRW